MRGPAESQAEDMLPLRPGWPRVKHVLKHLYCRRERWDLVITGLPTRLRERALHAGCSLIDRVQDGSETPEPVCSSCSQLIEADHEAYYCPAYMDSIRTAGRLGRVGVLREKSGLLAHVGSNGVFVVSTEGSDGHPPRVVSAYRVVPPAPSLQRSEDFLREAMQRWRDKTTLCRRPR